MSFSQGARLDIHGFEQAVAEEDVHRLTRCFLDDAGEQVHGLVVVVGVRARSADDLRRKRELDGVGRGIDFNRRVHDILHAGRMVHQHANGDVLLPALTPFRIEIRYRLVERLDLSFGHQLCDT